MAPRRESGVPSARTVLEVADGLRWSDPGLGASLAEHALRLAGDDAAIRTAAERSVIRSLAEVDRFDEVVARATPLLDDAQVRGHREDLAGLLAELAGAAMGLGDVSVAERLVDPVGSGGDLSARTAILAGLVRAQVAAATGDVAGADRAAEEAVAALRRTPEPEAGLVRRDLARARAAARRRGGQPGDALPILAEAISPDPAADADGGRRSLLAAADEVDLLLDLGRQDEALERSRRMLPAGPAGPLAVCPTARIRLALSERVHLVARAHAEAQSLARSAATELEAAGHDAPAARAWELVASAAEQCGELGAALTAVRHAHEIDSRARDRRDPALRVLTMIAAAAPDLPVDADGPAGARAADPVSAPGSSALSEVESLLADARSSVAGPVNGSDPLPRRRGHRRADADDDGPPSTGEPVPDALARLLGPADLASTSSGAPSPGADGASGGTWGGTYGDRNGRHPGTDDVGLPTTTGPSVPGPSRRSRHSAEPSDELLAEPEGVVDPTTSRPTFDVFPPAPGVRVGDADLGLDVGGAASGNGTGPFGSAGLPEVERSAGATNGRSPDVERASSSEPGPPGPVGRGPEPGHDPEPHRDLDAARDAGLSLLGSSLDGDWGRPSGTAREVEIDPADPLGTGFRAGAATEWSAASATGDDGRSRDGDPTASDSRTGPLPARSGTENGVTPSPGETGPDADSGTTPGTCSATFGTPAAPRDRRPRVPPPGFDVEDLDDELPLTLAGLLAEYHLPDVPGPPTPNGASQNDVAVPSARRHVSGSMPVPAADPRFATRAADAPGPSAPGPGTGATQGPPRRGENGARLADLLAEAMDAFRHTGPGDETRGSGEGATRGPGVGSRRG